MILGRPKIDARRNLLIVTRATPHEWRQLGRETSSEPRLYRLRELGYVADWQDSCARSVEEANKKGREARHDGAGGALVIKQALLSNLARLDAAENTPKINGIGLFNLCNDQLPHCSASQWLPMTGELDKRQPQCLARTTKPSLWI